MFSYKVQRNPHKPFDSEHASTEAGCELHRTRCSTALTCVLQCSEARTGCFTTRAESLRRLRLLATKSPMNEAHGTTLLHFTNFKSSNIIKGKTQAVLPCSTSYKWSSNFKPALGTQTNKYMGGLGLCASHLLLITTGKPLLKPSRSGLVPHSKCN